MKFTKREIQLVQKEISNSAREFAEKVQPIFEKMNWQWGWAGERHVPTVDDIIEVIGNLSDHLYADKHFCIVSTGRMQIAMFRGSDKKVHVDIQLVPEWKSISIEDSEGLSAGGN